MNDSIVLNRQRLSDYTRQYKLTATVGHTEVVVQIHGVSGRWYSLFIGRIDDLGSWTFQSRR